jgi:hypothetical protein
MNQTGGERDEKGGGEEGKEGDEGKDKDAGSRLLNTVYTTGTGLY